MKQRCKYRARKIKELRIIIIQLLTTLVLRTKQNIHQVGSESAIPVNCKLHRLRGLSTRQLLVDWVLSVGLLIPRTAAGVYAYTISRQEPRQALPLIGTRDTSNIASSETPPKNGRVALPYTKTRHRQISKEHPLRSSPAGWEATRSPRWPRRRCRIR